MNPVSTLGIDLAKSTFGLSLKFLTPRLGGMMQPEVFYGKADLRTGVQA